jgi:glycerophosphoryl diester phosphodiesterase
LPLRQPGAPGAPPAPSHLPGAPDAPRRGRGLRLVQGQALDMPAISRRRSMGENLWDEGSVSPAYRENTLLSFVKAVENGATFIEFDVQVRHSIR